MVIWIRIGIVWSGRLTVGEDVGRIVGDPIATTTSDPTDGTYLFEDLPDGNYLVSVTDTDNVLDGYDLTSGLDELPVTADSTAGMYRCRFRLCG